MPYALLLRNALPPPPVTSFTNDPLVPPWCLLFLRGELEIVNVLVAQVRKVNCQLDHLRATKNVTFLIP